jgi:hypothetical protein
MKVCTKCKLEKDFSEFNKRTKNKDGLRNECRSCEKKYRDNMLDYQKKYQRNYYLNNIDSIKEYRMENRERDKIKIDNWRKNNSEKIKIYNERNKKNAKIYYSENIEAISKQKKIYYSNNRDRILNKKKSNRDIINEYVRQRKKTDELYKLLCSIRSTINSSIKTKKFSKKAKTEEMLGCSFEEFKLYIESKFENWMSWENYGLYNGELNYGWDLDHIIPISSAKTEDEVIKLNHFTNFSPLCSYINRVVKKDKIDFNE